MYSLISIVPLEWNGMDHPRYYTVSIDSILTWVRDCYSFIHTSKPPGRGPCLLAGLSWEREPVSAITFSHFKVRPMMYRILPCQLNESKLNMTNWTEQLNKKPVKRKSTGQQQLNKKWFEQFVNWVKQFWQKSQLNISLIEQKSNWTSNYWTSSQLNNMPTEHWTSENWSSFNWTFYNWT